MARKTWSRLGLVLAVPILLAGCVSPAPPGLLVGGPGPAAGPTRDSFLRLLDSSRDLGPVGPDREVSFTVLLKDPGRAARQARLAATYDPRSPFYGRFLSPAEYSAFGPDPDRMGQAVSELRSAGVTPVWTPGDSWMTVAGDAGAMAAEFGVEIHDYLSADGVRFHASRRDPVLPTRLRALADSVKHLSSYHARVRTHAVPPGGLKPVDVALAYDIKALWDQGIDGSGETVAIWALGDSFSQADFDAFSRRFGLPQQTITVKGPAGGRIEGEMAMDVEVVHAIAPRARIIVYTAPQSQTEQVLQQMVADNPGGIQSHSWGGCESNDSSGKNDAEFSVRLYDKAAQLGESVFYATDDSGAYACISHTEGAIPDVNGLGTSIPAVAPGVTAVGGTRLSVSTDGSWYNEVAWRSPTDLEGTGGGVSHWVPRPSWQTGPGVDNQFNPRKMRSTPDVAAIADPESSMTLIVGGKEITEGGDSQACPLWAGIAALINQYLKKKGLKPLGLFNPALYALARGNPPFPPFHQITIGDNLYYPATPGYNLATGLGSPDVYNLARDLEIYQRNGGRL